MESFIDKLFVFLFLAFAAGFMIAIISIPTVVAFFIYRWLRNKRIKYVGIILLIIAPLWTIYEVYTAIYPRDSFYYSEFKEVTLREIPKSAVIIRKDASYPDFHGDYCSASLITLSTSDYNSLLNDLTKDKKITSNKTGEICGSDELDKVMVGYKKEQIQHSFMRAISGEEDHYLYIGFLDDNKTIVISVCVT
jgi:hypothetical protein